MLRRDVSGSRCHNFEELLLSWADDVIGCVLLGFYILVLDGSETVVEAVFHGLFFVGVFPELALELCGPFVALS